METDERTTGILKKLAEVYGLDKLKSVLADGNSKLFKSDIYISLKEITAAFYSEGNTLEKLKEAKNVYGSPVFAVNEPEGRYLIKNEPDFDSALKEMKKYDFCFKLSPYHIINTYLAVVEAQVTGFKLKNLIKKGEKHIKDLIRMSLKTNPAWDKETLTSDNPVLIMPVGAAGCGKSTLYRQLPNVVNISCDNIRYLLFKEFGPCFTSWESCLSWWVVNRLVDLYISRGYSVFYNGVNTDLEYRSPITMEDNDPLFQGIPYDIRIVYFEPPFDLNREELEELKSVNLWENDIKEMDLSKYSVKVAGILEMIKNNYLRTLERTKEISSGKKQQDPFDILYAVPAGVVKLFVEQSFDRPEGPNVTVVERKELPDPSERDAFYKSCAEEILS